MVDHNWAFLQEAETNWQFDIFGFAEQAQGNALSLLSFHFMQKFGNIQKLGFDQSKLATFVRVIEKGYDPKNPYHNRLAPRPARCWLLTTCSINTLFVDCTYAAVSS